MNEQILYRAIELKARSEEVEKQLQFVNEQIAELERFRDGLQFMHENNSKEILAPLGKGVYTKADLKGKEVFVEVGAGVVVKKTMQETHGVINEQIKKFVDVKMHLKEQLESYIAELGSMFEEVEKLRSGKKD